MSFLVTNVNNEKEKYSLSNMSFHSAMYAASKNGWDNEIEKDENVPIENYGILNAKSFKTALDKFADNPDSVDNPDVKAYAKGIGEFRTWLNSIETTELHAVG